MLAIGLVLLLVILAVWQRHLLLFTPWSNGTPPAFLNTQLELSPEAIGMMIIFSSNP
jgi:hypothetical protein